MEGYGLEEHEPGIWCWCRPKIMDVIAGIVIMHRDIDPSLLAVRYLYGGESDMTPSVPWWDQIESR